MMTGKQIKEGLNYAKKNFLDDKISHLWIDKVIINEELNLSNKRVLDFGCGMGGMSIWYATNWDCFVCGIDIDSHHIQVARALKEEFEVKNLIFEEKDILAQIPPGPYDIIFMNDVVEHIPIHILESILQRLSQMLRPEGIMYVSYPPWQGPYASHINRVLKLPWCQFLPDALISNYLEKNNIDIVGKLESTLLEVYKGLNKMSHKKLDQLLQKNHLEIFFRYSHSILNKKKLTRNINVTAFPFNLLITKEILFIRKASRTSIEGFTT
jgi:SAM-dependent methyltransferase